MTQITGFTLKSFKKASFENFKRGINGKQIIALSSRIFPGNNALKVQFCKSRGKRPFHPLVNKMKMKFLKKVITLVRHTNNTYGLILRKSLTN